MNPEARGLASRGFLLFQKPWADASAFGWTVSLLCCLALAAQLAGYVLTAAPTRLLTLTTRSSNYPAFIFSMLCLSSAGVLIVRRLRFRGATHLAALGFVAACLYFLAASPNGLAGLDQTIGLQWHAQADAVLHGHLALGEADKVPSHDIAIKDGYAYMAYPLGSVVFPLLFGRLIRLGDLAAALLAIYLFTYLGRLVRETREAETDLFVALATLFLFAVRNSSSFYVTPFFGAPIFIALAFILMTKYLRSAGQADRLILAASACLLAATLFRTELILLFTLPALCIVMKRRPSLWKAVASPAMGGAVFFGALSLALILIQNEAKFGDPFEAGLKLNSTLDKTDLTNALLRPISLANLPRQVSAYFLDLPHLDCSVVWYCADFRNFGGSEPGGYMLWRYPFLIAGFVRSMQAILDRNIPRARLPAALAELGLPRPGAVSLMPLAGALITLAFYLLCFQNSARYHLLFGPLFMTSAACYFPKDRRARLALQVLSLAVNLAIYNSFFQNYPQQS